jgi:hypothetical protein
MEASAGIGKNTPQPARFVGVKSMKSNGRGRPLGWPERVGFAAIGLGLVGNGLAPLIQGRSFYANYWGGAVFAPVSLIIGIAVILMALLHGRMKSEESSRRRRKNHL